ncbi:MAG: hypothetical protein C4308_05080 [Chitinophagaceae bacterium]
MKKVFQLGLLSLLWCSTHIKAQTFAYQLSFKSSDEIVYEDENEIKAAQQLVNTEQKNFRDFLNKASIDKNIRKEILKFISTDIDKIQNNLAHLVTAPVAKRAKGIHSISFFLKELRTRLEGKEFNEFKVPEIIKKYRQTLTAIMNNESLEKQFKGIGWRSSQMLANAF